MWAILGLVLCTLLMLFSGWAAIYDLCARSPGVDRGDAIVDLAAAYLGVSHCLPHSNPSILLYPIPIPSPSPSVSALFFTNGPNQS